MKITRLVIIHSLDDRDANTIPQLVGRLKTLNEAQGLNLEIVSIECTYAKQFSEIVSGIIEDINKGVKPLLHIECHGDKKEGLIFANGSNLSWEELSAQLLKINIAMRFNLLLVILACYGGFIEDEKQIGKQAPYWGLITPIETIKSSDAIKIYFKFYDTLLSKKDLALAFKKVIDIRLGVGSWHVNTAESWYLAAINYYINKHHSKPNFCELVKCQLTRLHADNSPFDENELEEIIVSQTRDILLNEGFDTYFCIDQIEENRTRYGNFRRQIESILNKKRQLGYEI